MPKQSIFLISECDLSLSMNRLRITYPDGKSIFRPIEDIITIVVDYHSIHITIPLLNALVEEGITVIFCDDHHIPTSSLHSLCGHYLHGARTRHQLDANAPVQKQLWKQVVVAKIKNQSKLLTEVGLGDDPLKEYHSNVKSGDSTNREAVAARQYWKMLFGKDFIRDRFGDTPNDMLNYGYAILRANIARALVGKGLLLEIGLFHKNCFNSMPLADDIMEPFRPYIDRVVWRIYQSGKREIDKNFKYQIMNIFYTDLPFDTLAESANSLARVYDFETNTLIFPSI